MKEMSLFKVLTGVFAFLMCMLLVIAPCFGFAVISSPVSTSSKTTSVTFTGYDLLMSSTETDDTTLEQLYDNFKMDRDTIDALNADLLIGKIDVIVMIVVGSVGMILSAMSIFLFSNRTNNSIAIGFSVAAGVLTVLLLVLSIIFVATMNNFIPASTSSLVVVKTSVFVALILMGVVTVSYLVYAIIAKRNGKTGAGNDVHVSGNATKADVEDATLKLLVAYKKAADEGVVGEMDFVEMKRAALIASNRGDVAYLQKQLYGIEKLAAYKTLFDQGVLTESEFNYKKNHLGGTAM